MSEFKNSQVIYKVLKILIDKISRRTSQGFAANLMYNIIKDLTPKYNFLEYVKIANSAYFKEIEPVNIDSEVDSAGSTDFYNAVKDIIEMTIRHLGEKANFFFIREFQEALEDIEGLNLKEKNIDLGLLQFQYIINEKLNDRVQESKIENSEIMEKIITTLIRIVNRILSEEQTMEIIITSISKLVEKYDFLKYIKISNAANLAEASIIRVLTDINSVHSSNLGEAIQKLLEDIVKSVAQGNEELFIENFKKELGNECLFEIKMIGVNLEHLKVILLRQEHELLVEKILETLIKITSKNTSKDFAIRILNDSIEKLNEKHDVLKYVKIDKSQDYEGVSAISVLPEINKIESYKLGKAIREVIKIVGEELGVKKTSFIEDFKKHIGDEYLNKIEKIGVNLHFLEFKFV